MCTLRAGSIVKINEKDSAKVEKDSQKAKQKQPKQRAACRVAKYLIMMQTKKRLGNKEASLIFFTYLSL